jgi:murein L,D-transpeptidase YafK
MAAMGDSRIEEIYTLAQAAFKNGQENIPVHLFPFPMTQKNLFEFKDSKWLPL